MIGIRDDAAPAPLPPSRAPELSARIFAEAGLLQENLSLEHRPGQERMANAVAAAFRDDKPILFEAGTGIGKSLAYLVPGIIHATDCGRQMIVSTHTNSLQEQIDGQDLPLCRRLFSSAPELATRIRRRVGDQKDLLGLCAYDADQAGVPAAKSIAVGTAASGEAIASPTAPGAAASISAPDAGTAPHAGGSGPSLAPASGNTSSAAPASSER